jgi:hypothetical protein
MALILTAAFSTQTALASEVALSPDGQWQSFDVTPDLSSSGGLEWIDFNDGSALSFSFNGPATLTVVDGGFAGDQFKIYDNGNLLGETSAAVNNYPNSLGLDFDAALLDTNYSHGVFALGAGDHHITGLLSVSALDDTGMDINATVGAVQISAVPLPGSLAMLLPALGLLGFAARRRAC